MAARHHCSSLEQILGLQNGWSEIIDGKLESVHRQLNVGENGFFFVLDKLTVTINTTILLLARNDKIFKG
jgi:hypothetical protein